VIEEGTPKPVVAGVFAYPASGRCEHGKNTDDAGVFAFNCSEVAVEDEIVVHKYFANGYESRSASLVVPALGTAPATLVIALPTPMTPAATPTIVDYYGWSVVRGRVSGSDGPLPDAQIDVDSWFGPPNGGGRDGQMHCWSPVRPDDAGRFEVFCRGGRGNGWTKYRVRVTLEGFEPYENFYPIESFWGNLDVNLTPATVTPTWTPTVRATSTWTPDPRRFIPIIGP
jgi:hypothetical protein